MNEFSKRLIFQLLRNQSKGNVYHNELFPPFLTECYMDVILDTVLVFLAFKGEEKRMSLDYKQ